MKLEYNKRMKFSPNFNVSEFHCKDGVPVPVEFLCNCWYISLQLEKVRVRLGSPIKINSAYRTFSHNLKVGGSKTSNHLKGLAVDISSSAGYLKLLGVFKDLLDKGEIPNGEIIYYPKQNFIHYAPKFDLKYIN